MLVEVKSRLDPKDVPAVMEVMERYDAGRPLVVAPFLSPRTRERLTEAGASYADATGNLRIALDRPALYIQRTGASASPWSDERPLRSLKGPTAGRVVRALCDFRPPYGVREIALRSKTPLASVARVVELLDREAIVRREQRGPIESVDWPALLSRWTQDYDFIKSNRTAAFLEPRELKVLLDRLRKGRSTYAVTGSLAAVELSPVAPARLASIYVPSIAQAAKLLELRQVDAGTNVILAEPYDNVVFERTWERNGITYAAATQVVADLLTSPGRAPAEGEALIAWMKRNEDAWRS